MFGSFRWRLAATVIALITVTALVVAAVSYWLVRNSLRDQLVEDSVARAEFNITVLAATELLPADAGSTEFEASGLADRFLLRGTDGVLVRFGNGEVFASSANVLSSSEHLSDELQAIVAGGDFGYQFLDMDDALVVAARRPPSGPDFYFFSTTVASGNTLAQLARILTVTGLATVVAGALAAGLVARRMVRPVAEAARAAGTMAAGDLSVRIQESSDDELGELARSFNQMALSLDRQISELTAARRRERRFVADVAHELRTPLTAVVNEAAMLQNQLERFSIDDRGLGEMLVRDVDRLRTLVEDLLEASRLDATAAAEAEDELDLQAFLGVIVAERHPKAQLVVEVAEPILTNRASLERIVCNLVDNARHHATGADVAIDARLMGNELRLTVADDGPGVPPDQLPRIFDRFYKADESRSGGSGLGLAIAREHARLLGGDLQARTRTGGGLEFELVVPVTQLLQNGDTGETRPDHSDLQDRTGEP